MIKQYNMKKVLYSAFALLIAGLGLTACEDEVDTSEAIVSNTPAKLAAGTYNGVFTISSSDSSNEVPGSVVVKESDPFVCEIVVTTSDGSVSEETDVANIVNKNNKETFVFDNYGAQNLKGLIGSIENGELKLYFFKSVKDGRKTVSKDFNFVGRK